MLEGLPGNPDAIFRAAWLLSLYYPSKGEAGGVWEIVAGLSNFADSVTGQKLLARAYLGENRKAKAIRIY